MNSFLTFLASKSRLIVALLIFLGVVLGALQLHPHLGVFNDDAEYLVLGDALAGGQGYTWANDPLEPPHNKYPPGYPLAVAGVLLLTGNADDAYGGIVPVKLLTLLAFAGALAVLWLLLSRTQREPGLEPLLAVGLLAVNPFVLEYAVQIMSELPYTLLSLLTLWVAVRVGLEGRGNSGLLPALFGHSRSPRHSGESSPRAGVRSPSSADRADAATTHPTAKEAFAWRQLALLAALATLCYYLRGPGVTIAVSLVLWLLVHRQVRGALVIGGASAVLIGVWQVRNAIVLPVNIYAYQFFLKEQEDPLAGTIGLTDFLARIADNAEHYVLAGFLDVNRPGVSLIVGAIAAAGWLVAAFGWGVHLRRQFSLMAVYTFIYLGLIVIWPYASGRFLIPVLPFVGYYGLLGGRVLLERILNPRTTQGVLLMGASALIIALVLVNAVLIRTNLERWSTDPAQYYGYDPPWSSYLQTAQWLGANLATEDIILARRHFAMYVYSGRLTAKYRYDTDDYEMGYLLSGTETKFVIEDSFAGARGDFSQLLPALEARNGGLELVYTTPRDPPVRVWRLERPPAEGSQ